MSSEIEFVVEWTVTGDPERFRALALEAAAMVRAEEPKALRYLWYANPDGTRYVLTECYADSEAMLAHGKNIARLLPELEKIAKVTRFEILGDLSPEAEAAAARIGAARYRFSGGMRR
jgi:quinol monooxygenase YgiN